MDADGNGQLDGAEFKKLMHEQVPDPSLMIRSIHPRWSLPAPEPWHRLCHVHFAFSRSQREDTVQLLKGVNLEDSLMSGGADAVLKRAVELEMNSVAARAQAGTTKEIRRFSSRRAPRSENPIRARACA